MTVNDPILQQISRFSPQDILLADVAIRIQLSPTDYLAATGHYEAMAAWIDRPDSPLHGQVVEFYPQGGFSTGSTVAGHNEDAEFDLDGMAAIDWRQDIDPEAALATLHKAISAEKGSRYYEKAERKTRCTQVHYARMHLDVTPSVLITAREAKTSWIFHSKPSDPTVRKARLFANPYGLAEWFNNRTRADLAFGSYFERASLGFEREVLAARADTAPVPEQLPAYRKSRQVICLQLIKRWRNIAYDRRHPGLRLPPSVLLTFYVGLHTGAERSLLDELIHQVDCIIRVIEGAAGEGRLVRAWNPTCPEDELTDRWPGSPADQMTFLKELHDFSSKLGRLKAGLPMRDMSLILEELFGEKPAREAIAAFSQRQVNDNNANKGLYIPGRGAVPALGSFAAPSTARAIPRSTPFGD